MLKNTFYTTISVETKAIYIYNVCSLYDGPPLANQSPTQWPPLTSRIERDCKEQQLCTRLHISLPVLFFFGFIVVNGTMLSKKVTFGILVIAISIFYTKWREVQLQALDDQEKSIIDHWNSSIKRPGRQFQRVLVGYETFVLTLTRTDVSQNTFVLDSELSNTLL